MSKPNVYFVGGMYQGCNYLRCYLPMIYNGWTGSKVGYSKQDKPLNLVKDGMDKADIVVFHRADTIQHHKVGMMLKKAGKKIVFDNDDTYNLDVNHPFFGLDERGFAQNKTAMNNIINNFILNSDLVTTTTDYLAEEYKRTNKNVIVLPNYVNPKDWEEPLRNETDKVRIGLVGSVAYHHDFYLIKDIIRELGNREDVTIVLFGLNSRKQRETNPLAEGVLHKEYEFWDTLKNIEHFPWCDMGEYFDVLNELRLDMMLIPRREDDFNKSKSNVKFLEAGMCEIPVIASSFSDGNSPYDKDIKNYENGILVKPDGDWKEAIESLIKDKQLRREIGRNAKQYVINNYNIADHYKEWQTAYETLL